MEALAYLLGAVGSLAGWLWDSQDLLRVVLLGALLLVALTTEYFLKRVETYRRKAPAAPGKRRRTGRLEEGDQPLSLPFVSILVPARNEQDNIERCVLSLLAQDYPAFEVVVLDDESTDATLSILGGLATSHGRLRVLRGQPLPVGWLGKHWACQQLGETAKGELLLFTDADTWHHPQALRDAVAAQQAEDSDLLTGIPHEEAGSWGEILVMPIINWAMLSLLPLGLAHRLKRPSLSMGIGQFMLFRRTSYLAVGGFEAVRLNPVDDMALARRIKELDFRWRFVDLSHRVRCRMYRGFRGVADGLGKTVFPALGFKTWVLAVGIVFSAWLYLAPVTAACAWLLGLLPAAPSLLWAGVAIGLALAGWGLALGRFGHPWYRAVFYPLTIALTIVIGARSAYLFCRGEAGWKGRTLPGLGGRRSGEEGRRCE